jgi:hypothetical protein
MAPDARKYNLLYVSTRGTDDVYVFALPNDTLVGTLTGFTAPQGECVDAAADVFISDAAAQEIVEYAHGGTTPIATLSDSGWTPQDCAIDPTTGNLAVANNAGPSSEGGIAIYAHASGTPTYYMDSAIYRPYFCGYDKKGNLFLDGTGIGGGQGLLAELPNGSSSFTNITLNQYIYSPGGVLSDGKYVAVGDEGNGYVGTTAIYEFSVRGSSGTIVNSTPFPYADDITQFWLTDKRSEVIAPDEDGQYVGFFNFPVGGSPTKEITGYLDPVGAAVSKK